MNFQQLRTVHEAIQHDFNLTNAADALHVSQSAISRQIRELEEELGLDIFVRHGKRLTGLTAGGKAVAHIVGRILEERNRLRETAEGFRRTDSANLAVAATHAQVRYRLPGIVMTFRETHPSVHLTLHQTSPLQVIELLKSGQADLGLVTEGLPRPADFVTFKAWTWTHQFIAPQGHPLLQLRQPSLADIVHYPIITFEEGMVGRERIEEAFRREGLQPDIVISAVDSDVIKTYVALGLGVGIVAARSFDPMVDKHLAAISTGTPIAPITTSVAVRQGRRLPDHAISFIRSLIPALTADDIRARIEVSPDSLAA